MASKSEKQEVNSKDKSQLWTTLIAAISSILVTLISVGIPIIGQLNERDAKISTLQTQVEEQDNQILDLQTELGKRDTEIALLKEQLKSPNLANPLQTALSQGTSSAQFEWQWAGENWYGRVTLQKQGDNYVITQAKVGIMEKNIEDRHLMNGQVLNLAPNTPGAFTIIDNNIRIELPVMKKDRRTGLVQLTTIKGTLQQSLCYAGRVLYLNDGGQYQGDIVLVNYSPIFAPQLDDWFLNEQEWFEEYIVDRQ